MRDMTVEEATLAQELFKSGEMPPPAKGEGKERLTVRFDPGMPGVVYYGPHSHKIKRRIPGAVVLSWKIDPTARTPNKVRYVRQTIVVRTKDGRKWHGTLKSGTDVVILKLRTGMDGKDGKEARE